MITETIKLSQTALKQLEEKFMCQYLWQKVWIEKAVKVEPTLAMKRGSYFEYLAIGGGAGHGEDVTDLPRGKDGKKLVDQIRIEEQAEAFKKNFTAMGFTILEGTKQMKLTTDDFEGIVDFFAIENSSREKAIWDTKLTADIYTDFGFTTWGQPEAVDFTQQFSYCRAWWKLTGEILPCYLYVADYTPSKNVKVLKLQFDALKRFQEIDIRLKDAYGYIEAFVNAGVDMPHKPSNKNCRNCPLKESCIYKIDHPQPELVVLDF